MLVGGGAGWSWLLCGVGVCGYLQLSRRGSPSVSLSLTGSVQHFQSLAVESDRGGWCCCWIGWGSGALGGRGCISLYIQLKSRIYT